MRRALLLVILTIGAIAVIGAVAACGGDGGDGLTVLGGSPTASSAVSPAPSSTSASPAASPGGTPSATPSPVLSGSGGDPFAGGELTADQLAAYLAEVKPVYKEAMRVEDIAGDMLVEVSAVPDDSWDTAAARTNGYAEQIGMQHDLWVAVTPPAGLEQAHDAAAQSFATEAEMLALLATQLTSRTWNVVKGTKDVNRLAAKTFKLRDSYEADLKAMAADLGVRVPWKWQ
jgi:hypothetical protein